MTQKSFTPLLGSLLSFILLVVQPAPAQKTKPKADREMDRVQAMIAEAKQEAEQFTKAGGKADDPKHPNLKWAATFWNYRLKHPGTPATAAATAQTFTLLNRADRVSEMQAKADTLKPDEAAWRQVIFLLFSASIRTKDYSYFLNKAEALTQSANDPNIQALARFKIGEAYWRKKDIDQARTEFQTVIAKYANTSYAEDAKGNLREIEFLNVGQLAPQFEGKTINGDPFSLGGQKGQIVVLKFWGTYCAQCMEESPLLKEFHAKYKDQGVVVVGISLDEEVKPVQEVVTNKGYSWSQVWDGDETIQKLFNITGTPTYYVLDKEGKIAAKNLPSFKRMNTAVDDLLKKP